MAEDGMIRLGGHTLDLWAQPIIELRRSHHVVAHELLIRAVPSLSGPSTEPAHLVQRLERQGSVTKLDCWVAEQACRLLPPGGRLNQVQVNVSGRTAADHLDEYLEHLSAALAERRIDPGRLTLELTESWPIGVRAAQRFCSGAAELGCRVSLDDFGAGGQSLQMLVNLDEISQVKLDGALVRACATSDRARHIVVSCVKMADSVGAEIVAESIPNLAVGRWLAAAGAELGQAFLYGRPVPVPDSVRDERLAPPEAVTVATDEAMLATEEALVATAGQVAHVSRRNCRVPRPYGSSDHYERFDRFGSPFN